MGIGIAHVAALAGFEVQLYDVALPVAQAGKEKIANNLQVGVSKGKVTASESQQALAHISCAAELQVMAPCQLVIEAIPEVMHLKQELFKTLSSVCSHDSIFASNTSSLSLTEIAASATHPNRVVGLHFFNPVHLMKLLEVVRAYQTSNETVEAVKGFGAQMKKELIVVKDSPGFASSRLGVTLGLEAIRMLEEGVGSAEDIDRAMKLGYGHPMGPLELGDLVGLDIRLAIAEYLYSETGSATFRPPQLLKKMVRAGKLGKKSGEGFYSY